MDARRRAYGLEWPTILLVAAVYAAWMTITLLPVPPLIAIPLLAVVLVLHSSLQHEAVHGHPFPNARLSEAVMTPGVGLVIPYGRFRDLHLLHHKDANLTDPYDDPESAYFAPEHYASLPRWLQLTLRANNTFAGRFLLGPAVGLQGFFRTEWQLVRAGSERVIRDWAIHGATVVPILIWIWAAPIPLWAYLAAAYLALSILKIRTFVEHQAHELASGRSVIIEDRGPLAFLFLNNNLHSVHHAHPQVAWYDLPGLFRSRREEYLRRNRGYHFRSYAAVARAFLFTPKDSVPHPLPAVRR